MKRLLLAICAALLWPLAAALPAQAQTVNAVTVANCGSAPNTPVVGNPYPIYMDTTGKLCVNATVSASATIGAFAPTSATSNTPLSVTTSSASVALPAGVTQIVQNTGANTVYLALGVGSATATTAGYPLLANDKIALAPATNTFIAGITASGTSTLTISGGSGFPALAGTGGGGSGAATTTTAVSACARAISAGAGNPFVVNLFNALCVVNVDPATGAPLDPAAPGNCGPTSTFIQCATKAGQPTLDTAGAPIVPQAAAANRTLTGTNLTLNTNTTICPAATNPVATEIYFTTAGVGVGLNGQTLTTATPSATTTSTPDFVSTAGQYYLAPVGISNAITAYGAAGVVRCIQTGRQ